MDLTGKEVFHLGTHTKGGGCDFLVPTPNIKFHSALKVAHDGSVTITYCHPKARACSLRHAAIDLVKASTCLSIYHEVLGRVLRQHDMVPSVQSETCIRLEGHCQTMNVLQPSYNAGQYLLGQYLSRLERW